MLVAHASATLSIATPTTSEDHLNSLASIARHREVCVVLHNQGHMNSGSNLAGNTQDALIDDLTSVHFPTDTARCLCYDAGRLSKAQSYHSHHEVRACAFCGINASGLSSAKVPKESECVGVSKSQSHKA